MLITFLYNLLITNSIYEAEKGVTHEKTTKNENLLSKMQKTHRT